MHDFNPRSREGSDDGGFISMRIMCKFQSTLPRRERRHRLPVEQKQKLHFNPRSREGSDDTGCQWSRSKSCISIHAPAKGATVKTGMRTRNRKFQSTLPRRERQYQWVGMTVFVISIHAPAKGATMLAGL